MATDPTILAVREMIGLVKQNIEFTLKKDVFLHCLKPKKPFGSHVKSRQIPAQQSLDDQAANGYLEPRSVNSISVLGALAASALL